MVGGLGERRTLRTLAKYGDLWNLDGFAMGREDARASRRNVPEPVQA